MSRKVEKWRQYAMKMSNLCRRLVRDHATYFDEVIETESYIESMLYYRFFVKQNNAVLKHILDMTTEDVVNYDVVTDEKLNPHVIHDKDDKTTDTKFSKTDKRDT